jgi:hypothetical protein
MKTTYFTRVLLLAGFILLSTPFFVQNLFEINGKIVHSNKVGAKNATVTLLDSKTMEIFAKTECDDNGDFVIKDVKKGDYILLAQKKGFKNPVIQAITISGSGSITESANLAFMRFDKDAFEADIN